MFAHLQSGSGLHTESGLHTASASRQGTGPSRVGVVGSCLAAAGLAVAGIGLAAPAQASQAPTDVGLGSQTRVVGQGVVAPSAAQTMTTKFRWADGSTVKATVVSGSGAKEVAGADISNRTVAWTKWDQMVGVLSDGRGVGLKDGKLHYADAKGQLHLFNSGWTPTVDDAWLQGNRAYGVRYSADKGGSQFFDLGSVGGKVSQDAPWLQGDRQVGSYAVHSGRVYWTRLVMSGGVPVRAEVVSRSMKGGAVRLEAKSASDPSIVDGGVGVVTHKNDTGDWTGGPVTGAKLLGGKNLVSYTGTWPNAGGPDDGMAELMLSGHTVAVANVGGKGTIIMDTKAKKAWWVSAPGKALAMRPTIGSNRVVWPWLEMGNPSAVANRQISVFDAGKLRKLTANGNPQQAYTNGGAVAYSAIAPADGRDSFAAMRVR